MDFHKLAYQTGLVAAAASAAAAAASSAELEGLRSSLLCLQSSPTTLSLYSSLTSCSSLYAR